MVLYMCVLCILTKKISVCNEILYLCCFQNILVVALLNLIVLLFNFACFSHASVVNNKWLTFYNIQIVGYLSGSSPHMQSGAVSALSVLAYKDIDIFLSGSDLVPSLLSLLHTKAVEVIKVSIFLLKLGSQNIFRGSLH